MPRQTSAPAQQRSPAETRITSDHAAVVVFADLMAMCGPGSQADGSGPDQGERVFLQEVSSRLMERVPTAVYSSSRESFDRVQQVPSHRLIGSTLASELWRRRPRAIVYVYPVTLAALVRARLLRLFGHGARVTMIALASHPLDRLGRIFGRLLWPHLVLVTSESERRRLSSLGARVDTFPLGVDLARFRPPLPGEKQALRRNWGLPLDTAIVLHVGHLVAARNLTVLIALAAQPGVTPVVLVSHVRDSGSEELLQELRKGGVIVLEGYQRNVEELYRAADCYVFPSTAWGGGIELPLSVLEALASDLPVASTWFGALPERFRQEEGVRFAATDQELAQAVVELVQSRPHTRHLVEKHSWDAVAERLLSSLGYGPAPSAQQAGAGN